MVSYSVAKVVGVTSTGGFLVNVEITIELQSSKLPKPLFILRCFTLVLYANACLTQTSSSALQQPIGQGD